MCVYRTLLKTSFSLLIAIFLIIIIQPSTKKQKIYTCSVKRGSAALLNLQSKFCIYKFGCVHTHIFFIDHGVTWKKAGTLYGIPYGSQKLSGDFIPDEPQVCIYSYINQLQFWP